MPRKSVTLKGILVAASTPFTADGSAVDEPVLVAQVDRLIAAGMHGLVPCGTTGEFTTLSPEEYRRVIELYVTAADGRIPVVAGVGALSTAGAIDLARYAEQVGADAIMLVPPFYDPLSFETLKVFLADVAGAISLPIVYYNVPGATGIRLTRGPDRRAGRDRRHRLPEGHLRRRGDPDRPDRQPSDKIKAFNGWDTLTFFGIASGAEASVWGAAGVVPELAVELWETLAEKGDLVGARELWRDLWAISDFLESVDYVAGIKAGLELLGRPVGPPRRPIQPLPAADREKFAGILKQAGLTVGSQ